MLAVQHRLSLARPRVRSCRRRFVIPSIEGASPYRLPQAVRDRLEAVLAPFRNREAAYALAVFLARFWSSPTRIVEAFPIDRRALAANVPDQDAGSLTEKRIRTAILTLEEVGFLDRATASGSRYKATEHGLRKKPIRFTFGSEYMPLFIAANRRAAVARGRSKLADYKLASRTPSRPSTASPSDFLKGPKSRNPSESSLLMGPIVKSGIPPSAFEDNPNLGRALEGLEMAFRQSRDGSGEGSAR